MLLDNLFGVNYKFHEFFSYSNPGGKGLCLWRGHQWQTRSRYEYRYGLRTPPVDRSQSVCHQEGRCTLRQAVWVEFRSTFPNLTFACWLILFFGKEKLGFIDTLVVMWAQFLLFVWEKLGAPVIIKGLKYVSKCKRKFHIVKIDAFKKFHTQWR